VFGAVGDECWRASLARERTVECCAGWGYLCVFSRISVAASCILGLSLARPRPFGCLNFLPPRFREETDTSFISNLLIFSPELALELLEDCSKSARGNQDQPQQANYNRYA
jgi:hypothetical protein